MTGAVETAVATLTSERMLVIVRIDGRDAAVTAARAAIAGGARVLEFSLAATEAVDAIATLRESEPDALIGAGTVMSIADAEGALAAGVQFLVAPNFDPGVMEWAREHGVLHIPGALTPTEVATAAGAGAELIKLFPASAVGPAYVAQLLGPMPGLRLVPTGGVEEADVSAYLKAGAAALAFGGAIAKPGQSEEQTTERARRIKKVITESRRD